MEMKKNVAIVTGGNSKEAVISIQSAGVIGKNIDFLKYNSYIIIIDENNWYYKNDDNIKVDKNDFSLKIDSRKIIFDVIFIAIHGNPGEDGFLQAYFDLLGLPYTSCGMLTSALTFNKSFCNDLVASYGIPVGKSVLLVKDQIIDSKEIIAEIGLPCFVKPNQGGSSIGISKVSVAEAMEDAIAKAFEQDTMVLIQEFIEGREITCGIMSVNKELITFPLTEIVSFNEFFDYDAKYAGKSNEITPAPVCEALEKECKRISVYLYKKLNCKGVVRFDYIVNNDKFYFLEVNTVPGMSENSLVPQQVKNYGMSIDDFFTILIEEALRKE
jgi:D-alanine-D-alanine ligase